MRAIGTLRREIQTGLAAEIRQQRVGALLFDDLRRDGDRQRLDVGHVRHAGIGHDGGGVRVHQHDLVAERAQGFAGLRAGVIKLARLADDDGTGTDDQDLLDVVASWHGR
jgi:hypothetical protein